MRWFQKYKAHDCRTKRRFLFFPKCIHGETRWLCMASWKEMLKPSVYGWYWSQFKWVDNEDVLQEVREFVESI